MKKILSLLLSLTLVFSLAGCGEAKTATYSITSVQEGITMTDTQYLEAKGDILKVMNETTVLDLSTAEAEMKDFLVAYYDEAFGAMKDEAPASVTIEYGLAGDTYSAKININLEGADLQELIDGGYLVSLEDTEEDTENLKYISYSQTCKALEAAGYLLQQ